MTECLSFIVLSSFSLNSYPYQKSRYCHGVSFLSPPSSFSPSYGCSLESASFWRWRKMAKKRKPKTHRMRASMRESPYDVLGVSPSSNSQQIKRAYRKLALKYHPDVNKEKDAEEKFMRIKHAYNTLMSPKGKRENYPNTRTQGNQSWRAREEEEEFYGFGDFFRDLQVEYENWESSANSQERPKSLWEELSDIGEEFVEFLEKELNIADKDPGDDNGKSPPKNNSYEYDRKNKRKGEDEDEKRNINDNIDDVEAALAKLKKELGL